MIEIKKILVPVDFSKHSTHALDMAVGLAKTLSSEVHLVHVLHYPVQVAATGQMAIPADLWSEIREAATRKLEETAQGVKGEGLSVETHLSEGPNAHAIVELAENTGIDLIVMGTRGLSGLKHVMLGSVAERTVRLAHCPVLTVKAEE